MSVESIDNCIKSALVNFMNCHDDPLNSVLFLSTISILENALHDSPTLNARADIAYSIASYAYRDDDLFSLVEPHKESFAHFCYVIKDTIDSIRDNVITAARQYISKTLNKELIDKIMSYKHIQNIYTSEKQLFLKSMTELFNPPKIIISHEENMSSSLMKELPKLSKQSRNVESFWKNINYKALKQISQKSIPQFILNDYNLVSMLIWGLSFNIPFDLILSVLMLIPKNTACLCSD